MTELDICRFLSSDETELQDRLLLYGGWELDIVVLH